MNILQRLPEDLSVSILKDWLPSWKVLSALDVAFAAPPLRAGFLTLIGHPSVQLCYLADAEHDENAHANKMLDEHLFKKDDAGRLAGFLCWVHSRGQRLEVLEVHAGIIPDVVKALTFDTLPSIKKVVIRDIEALDEDDGMADYGYFEESDDTDSVPELEACEHEGSEQSESSGWEDVPDGEGHEEGSASDEDALPDLIDDDSDHDYDDDFGDDDDEEEEDEEASSTDDGDGHGHDDVLSAESFRAFLAHFPSLTAVNCYQWECMQDIHLEVLTDLPNPLTSLVLLDCADLDPAAIANAVFRFSDTLQTFICSAVEHLPADVIPSCKNIKVLAVGDADAVPIAQLKELCAAFPDLERLCLRVMDNYSDEEQDFSIEDIDTITGGCRKLKSMDISTIPELGAACLAVIQRNCPALTSLGWNSMKLTIKTDTSGSRYCTVHIIEEFIGNIEDLDDFLKLSWLPVQEFVEGPVAYVGYGTETLEMLGQYHGKSLRKLQCTLLDDEEDGSAVLNALLSRCPLITDLQLSTESCMIGDSALTMIPTHCPLLTAFTIRDADLITSGGVHLMLDKLRGRNMRSLCFPGAGLLSSAVLSHIMKLFPNIGKVDMRCTRMGRASLWKMLASGVIKRSQLAADSSDCDDVWIAAREDVMRKEKAVTELFANVKIAT